MEKKEKQQLHKCTNPKERERETSTIDVTVAQQKTAATTAKNLTWNSSIWMQKKRAKSVLFTGSETRLTRMRDEQEKEKSKKKKRASRQDKKKQICKKKKNYDTLQNENPHFKKKCKDCTAVLLLCHPDVLSQLYKIKRCSCISLGINTT